MDNIIKNYGYAPNDDSLYTIIGFLGNLINQVKKNVCWRRLS